MDHMRRGELHRVDVGGTGRLPETQIGAGTRELLAALVAPPMAPGRVLPPHEFDGLRIVRPLGRGGMSQVFLADEPALGRQVAVKVLDEGADESWLAEARAIGGLRHPGLVALHRVGVVRGRPYLVYELVPGVTLASATVPMPGWRVLRIGRDLSSALAAVHATGFVHGDLKPSNVMLAPDPIRPGAEIAKLIDFGIAHREDRQPNVRAGTPRYMAPEVLQGRRATTRSDAYALALVLLEMITGGLDRRALDELPRSTRSSAWVVPSVLLDAIARTLSHDPERRLDARQIHDLVCAAMPEPARAAPSLALPWDPEAFVGVPLGAPIDRLETAGSTQTLWSPRPWLLCARQEGLLDAALAEVLIGAAANVARRGLRPRIFVDARESVGRSTAHDRALAAWGPHALATLGEMHVLTTLRVRAIARVRTHSDPASFTAALHDALTLPE